MSLVPLAVEYHVTFPIFNNSSFLFLLSKINKRKASLLKFDSCPSKITHVIILMVFISALSIYIY